MSSLTDSNNGKAQQSEGLLSYTVAAYLSLFITPGIFDLTAPFAVKFLTKQYGEEAAEWGYLAHGVVVVLVSFFALSRTTAMAIALISMAIARYGWRFAT